MLFDASKYLSHIALLTPQHLSTLIESASVRSLSKVVETSDFRASFFQAYQVYWKEGILDRANLSVGLSLDREIWEEQEVGNGRKLIRPTQPVVIVKPYTFMLSFENKLLSNVLGEEAIPFGLEFSFPALYRDPKSGENINSLKASVNARLFKSIGKWLRQSTCLLQIKKGDEMINTQMRIDEESRSLLAHMKGVALCVRSS